MTNSNRQKQLFNKYGKNGYSNDSFKKALKKTITDYIHGEYERGDENEMDDISSYEKQKKF